MLVKLLVSDCSLKHTFFVALISQLFEVFVALHICIFISNNFYRVLLIKSQRRLSYLYRSRGGDLLLYLRGGDLLLSLRGGGDLLLNLLGGDLLLFLRGDLDLYSRGELLLE